MVIQSARLAARQMFAPAFRGVLWKSLGLTILLFVAAWFVLEALVSTFLTPFLGAWPWITTALVWLLGTGMVLGAGFLLAPVTAIFAGLFLDDVAERVEAKYDQGRIGTPIPIGKSMWLAIRFLGLVLVANLFALFLLFVPGVNLIAFFVVNGYLLGREYFTFAAMRYRDEEEVNILRDQHSSQIFMGGLVIAGFMAVPLLNLLTPIFAACMMVHMHKMLSGENVPPFDEPASATYGRDAA